MLENNQIESDQSVPDVTGAKMYSNKSSESNTENRHKKNKKSVNFEASKEASLDLENILHERCKFDNSNLRYSG